LRKAIIAAGLILLLFVGAPAESAITVMQGSSEELKQRWTWSELCEANHNLYPNEELILREIRHLEHVLPTLKYVNWPVKWYNMTNNGWAGEIHGAAFLGSIAIFSGNYQKYSIEYVVTHEVGHLIRFTYLKDTDLEDYIKNRQIINKNAPRYTYDNTPEELFAEDFRMLFGSEMARKRPYNPTRFAKPGQNEKEWISKMINY
jgi:hypothetical protein